MGAKYQQIFQIGQHETMSHGQKRVAEFMTRAMLRYWLWAVAFSSRNCYLGTCLDIDTSGFSCWHTSVILTAQDSGRIVRMSFSSAHALGWVLFF